MTNVLINFILYFIKFKVSLVPMTTFLCLVSHIFFGFDVQDFSIIHKGFKKVGFQLPKNKGEITTLCKTLTVK